MNLTIPTINKIYNKIRPYQRWPVPRVGIVSIMYLYEQINLEYKKGFIVHPSGELRKILQGVYFRAYKSLVF